MEKLPLSTSIGGLPVGCRSDIDRGVPGARPALLNEALMDGCQRSMAKQSKRTAARNARETATG